MRSKAVHGETARKISTEEASTFHHAVKNTLDQYLDLASLEKIQTQSDLTTLLDKNEEHQTLMDWLLLYGGPAWAQYSKSIRKSQPPEI